MPATLIRTDRKVVYLAVNFVIVLLGCLLVPVLVTVVGGLPRPRHLDVTGKSFAGCVMAYMGFVIRDGVMMILSALPWRSDCLASARTCVAASLS